MSDFICLLRELKFVLKGNKQALKGFKQISGIIGFPFQQAYSRCSVTLAGHEERPVR